MILGAIFCCKHFSVIGLLCLAQTCLSHSLCRNEETYQVLGALLSVALREGSSHLGCLFCLQTLKMKRGRFGCVVITEEWCNVGLLRESSEFAEIIEEGHNFQINMGLDWAISAKPSHKTLEEIQI